MNHRRLKINHEITINNEIIMQPWVLVAKQMSYLILGEIKVI